MKTIMRPSLRLKARRPSAVVWLERAGQPAAYRPVTVTLEVERFCAANELTEHLKSGIQLARKHFSAECQIRLYVDTDPEDGDEYVVLEVNSSRDPAVDSEAHVHYLEEWSASVRWPASRMILLDVRSTD